MTMPQDTNVEDVVDVLQMTSQDRQRLALAHRLLEHPGMTARLSHLVGKPIEYSLAKLPKSASDLVGHATRKAILAALKVALRTMDANADGKSGATTRWHKAGAAFSGGVGGFFGLTAVLVELPVSTTLIMRSIADIARSEGADLTDIDTQLACVQVLGLGGRSRSDDAAELGYFASRQAMAKASVDAAAFLAKGGKISSDAAPALVHLIRLVTERFGIKVTEKVAAQAVPVVGAAAGALINTAFMNHYQDMARGHFIVRRLERIYGAEVVKHEYDAL